VSDARPRWVAVGLITRAHGVEGEVSVRALTELPGRFDPGARLFLTEGDGEPLTVSQSRPHRDRLLVSFEEVTDRDGAEHLRGRYLFVPAEWAPALPEGEFWVHQLVGATVRTVGGRTVGRIRDIVHTPANDVWVVGGKQGEMLVPALKDVVEQVDVDAGTVVINEVPGLTES
jgi:16S rRNA processing protein RimM